MVEKDQTVLTLNSLPKKLNKSKSSFYHYFGDLKSFQETLLEFHLERAHEIAQSGKQRKNVDPDVINLLVATKGALLFNKQLRLHIHNPVFKKYHDRASKKINDSFMDKWNSAIGFQQNPMLGEVILNLLRDNSIYK